MPRHILSLMTYETETNTHTSNYLSYSDVAMFGSLQALPSFLDQFGTLEHGKMVLPTKWKSVMNSGKSTFRHLDIGVQARGT
jgi:hypothetical protein